MLKRTLGPLIAAIGWLLWWPLVKASEFGGALIDIGTDWTLDGRASIEKQ